MTIFDTPKRHLALWYLLGGAVLWAACGGDDYRSRDDDDDGSTSSSASASGTSSGGGSPTSSSTGPGAGGAGGCTATCNTLYQCGLMNGNCPGFIPSEQQLFLDGPMNDGCIDLCTTQPALAGLVDGNDCAGTVSSLSAVSPEFDCVCLNGVSSATCAGGAAAP